MTINCVLSAFLNKLPHLQTEIYQITEDYLVEISDGIYVVWGGVES